MGTVAAGVAKAHSDVVLISGPRRRHRGGAAHLDQARRHAVGARAGGDAAGARDEQAARSDHRPGRRSAQDRARRGGGGAARRRGVRVLHRPARRHGLHHDAGLPPEHLPRGHRHPGPGLRAKFAGKPEFVESFFRFIAEEIREYMSAARLPHRRRDGRAGRPARREGGARPLQGARAGLRRDPVPAGRRTRGGHPQGGRAGSRPRAVHRHDDAAPAVRAGARAERAGGHPPAHPEREPHGGHHPGIGDHPALRGRRAARRHHPDPLERLGGPELRRRSCRAA